MSNDGSKVYVTLTSSTRFSSWIATDAMYFHAARRALAEARVAGLEVEAAGNAGPATGTGTDLARLYGPFLESLAVVHIMFACSLEAHINDCAAEGLSSRESEAFSKLSIEGKWLLLPRLLHRSESFDVGAEPFQGFKRLIQLRNGLVHCKPQRKDKEVPFGQPPALDHLGLTVPAAETSLAAAGGMIKRLAHVLDATPPSWIEHDWYDAFDFSIETKVSRG